MFESLLDTFPNKYYAKQDLQVWIEGMLKNKKLEKRSKDPTDKIKYKILLELIKKLHARLLAKDAVDKLVGNIPLNEMLSRKLGDKLPAFAKAMKDYRDSYPVVDALNCMINGSGTVFRMTIPANSKDIKRNKNKF